MYESVVNANARLKFQTFLPQANTIKCVENFAFVATQKDNTAIVREPIKTRAPYCGKKATTTHTYKSVV